MIRFINRNRRRLIRFVEYVGDNDVIVAVYNIGMVAILNLLILSMSDKTIVEKFVLIYLVYKTMTSSVSIHFMKKIDQINRDLAMVAITWFKRLRDDFDDVFLKLK